MSVNVETGWIDGMQQPTSAKKEKGSNKEWVPNGTRKKSVTG